MNRPSRSTWFLTHRCNIACTYCATILPDQTTPEMESEGETLAIANAITLLAPELVILTGGEATMHPHVQAVVDYFNAVGQEFVIITNATRPFTLKDVRNISSSVDTDDASYWRRTAAGGKDELYKSAHGLPFLIACKEMGMSPTASMVAGRANAHLVPDLIHRIYLEHGIPTMLGVLHQDPRTIPRHRWRFRQVGGEDQRLTVAQAQQLGKELAALKDEYPASMLNDRSYCDAIALHGAALDWHCTEAADVMVDSDGTVMTCQDHWGPRCKALNVIDVGMLGVDEWLGQWREAHAADNAECPGCAWNCVHQAESPASSVTAGAVRLTTKERS